MAFVSWSPELSVCFIVIGFLWFAIAIKAQTDFGSFRADSDTESETIIFNDYPSLVDGREATCFDDSFFFNFNKQIAVSKVEIIIEDSYIDANGVEAEDCEFQTPSGASNKLVFICSPVYIGRSMDFQNPDSTRVCEVIVVGFEAAPSVVADNLEFTYPEVAPFQINVTYGDDYYDFFPKTVFYTQIGDIKFQIESDNTTNVLISETDFRSMQPNVEYEVNVTRVHGDWEGPYYMTSISRGPICWVGQCNEKCADIFNAGDSHSFHEETSSHKVCTFVNGTPQKYQLSQAANCTDFCKQEITISTTCEILQNQFCCDTDNCFSPLVEASPDDNCVNRLANSPLQADRELFSCNSAPVENKSTLFDHPPNPMSYTTLTAESGYLTFSVNENVTGFDYVNLFINEGTDAYVCMAISTFEGNQNYTCIIPGLATNKMYNITLQGHNPDRDNGTVDGLTEMSEKFSIYQGGTFKLECKSNGYNIDFYFGDLSSSKTSINLATQTTPETSETGTVFDELVATQSSWYGEKVFVPPTSIFKGYPNAIVVQQQSNYIIILTSLYDFIDMPTYNGDPDSYDETLSEMFNLTDRRVVSVSGSFDGRFLNSIQFEAVDANGDKVESKCYGSGDCSGFTLNQTDSDHFFVGFAGKTSNKGYIRELTTYWASVDIESFYVGNADCMLASQANWNDISKYKYHYSVNPSDACGAVQSILDGKHAVVYDNSVKRYTGSQAFSNSITFGKGGMKVSRQLSGVRANIRCTYHAEGIVTSYFDTERQGDQKATGINSVTFRLHFYTDNSFTNAINSQAVLSVVSGERLFFGVSFKDMNAMDMTLYAHMCYAKKNDNPEFSDPSEILVLEEDGCPKEDDSFMRMDSVRSSAGEMIDPLSIQAFHWFDDPNMVVYLHCKVRACPSEVRENCIAPTTCQRSRRRRRDIMMDKTDSAMESFVSSQPIIIQRKTIVVAPGYNSVGTRMWLPTSVFCGIMAAFLVTILNAFRKQKQNKYLNYHKMKRY